jgi:hypothetical protein
MVYSMGLAAKFHSPGAASSTGNGQAGSGTASAAAGVIDAGTSATGAVVAVVAVPAQAERISNNQLSEVAIVPVLGKLNLVTILVVYSFRQQVDTTFIGFGYGDDMIHD